MLPPRSLRGFLSNACFALSSVWAAAGILKLVFGIRITFPLFPPIDLERVAVVPAIGVALGLAVVGAWLGRSAVLAARARSREIGAGESQLLPFAMSQRSHPPSNAGEEEQVADRLIG